MMCKEPFKVVCPFDPSIDHDRCSVETVVKYARERDLETIQPYFKPAIPPMVFHLRPIAAVLENWIMSAANDDEKNQRAFAASCFHIDKLWNEDRTRIDWTTQGADKEDTTLTEAELKRIPRACRQDIGQVALTRMLFLVPWSAPSYMLPPGSVLLLEQKFRSALSVAESPTNSTATETSSSSTESGESGTETESGAAQSGAPTAATATAPATP